MAVHDPKANARVKLHYNTRAGGHTLTVHLAIGATATDAAAAATQLANVLKTLLDTSQSFTSADFAPAGSNIFNPITWGPVAGTNGTAMGASTKAEVLTFTGRTVAGTRARLMFFTDKVPADLNYRITTAELIDVANVYALLSGANSPVVAPDGLFPVWHPYANVDTHERWVRKLRQG